MVMQFLRLTILIAVLALFGSPANAETKKTGLFCGGHSVSFSKRITACPVAVNGKSIAFFGISGKELASLSGRHKISLHVEAQIEFWVGPRSIRKDVVANLKQGRSYKADGRIAGRRIFVWIIDTATGDKVSSTATFKFKDCGLSGLKCLPWKLLED